MVHFLVLLMPIGMNVYASLCLLLCGLKEWAGTFVDLKTSRNFTDTLIIRGHYLERKKNLGMQGLEL